MTEVWLVVIKRKQCYQCFADEHVVGAYSTKELAEQAAVAVAHDEEQDDIAHHGYSRTTRDSWKFIGDANLDTLVDVKWRPFDQAPSVDWALGEFAKRFEARE